MKLPVLIVTRLNDLILYSFLDNNANVEKTYRLSVKRRLYVRCMRVYAELFKGKSTEMLNSKGGLDKPYFYNDLLEGDKFALEFKEDA
jgi:hypothetical protein